MAFFEALRRYVTIIDFETTTESREFEMTLEVKAWALVLIAVLVIAAALWAVL